MLVAILRQLILGGVREGAVGLPYRVRAGLLATAAVCSGIKRRSLGPDPGWWKCSTIDSCTSGVFVRGCDCYCAD